MMAKTVLFVCEHGALRSRVAAAHFNTLRPGGWRASSAGISPQATVSGRAAEMVRGSPAERELDVSPPRSILAAGAADRVIAIDCEVPDAERWTLRYGEGIPLNDEIAERVCALVEELRDA
jgi:protein-tyrosine-phosphatase